MSTTFSLFYLLVNKEKKTRGKSNNIYRQTGHSHVNFLAYAEYVLTVFHRLDSYTENGIRK